VIDLTALQEFLAPYPPEVQQMALAARERLAELVGPATEHFWDATQAVCAGFTYTHETKHNFINIAVYAKHVTLIFPWGVRLTDPEKRLCGEGNQVRNIRLLSLDDLHDPYVIDLIRQAQAGAVRPAEPLEPITIVKVMKGPKRRPTATQ